MGNLVGVGKCLTIYNTCITLFSYRNTFDAQVSSTEIDEQIGNNFKDKGSFH